MELCYILKLSVKKGDTYYKIGECEYGQNRVNDLIKKYTKINKLVDCCTLSDGIELPQNDDFRLDDKSVRKYLANSKQFKSVKSGTIASITHEDDGATEFIQPTDERLTNEQIVEKVKEAISTLGQDENNFKHKLPRVKMNETEIKEDEKTHLVTGKFIDQIDRHLNLYTDIYKTILFIGQFEHEWIASLAGYNKIYVLYDNRNTEYKFIQKLQNNIHTFTDTKELFKMCKKFDYIIANPPYAIGNDITATVRENCIFKQYINLMPVSKYKGDKLFKYVADIEKAEDKFEDATVGECLAIAELSKCETGKFETWDDFSLVTYDEKFRKFYEENRKRSIPYKKYMFLSIQGAKTVEEVKQFYNELNIDTDFLVPMRVCADGVDMGGYSYDWNYNKNISKNDLKIVRQGVGNGTQGGHISFYNQQERDNFTQFWYKDGKCGLMHKLIKGLNKHNGTMDIAIPRVDWSRPWTDREILADYGYTEEEINEILN